MNTTNTYDDTLTSSPETSDARRMVIAAVFAERDRAHDAVHRLHDEGFRDTWIGVTRFDSGDGYAVDENGYDRAQAGEVRVESTNWFMRFFGEGDESMHDALVRRGVDDADARAAGSMASTLPDQSAILTVDGGNHPELAAQLIAGCGGRLITRELGATGYGTPGRYEGGSMNLAAADTSAASTLGMHDATDAPAYDTSGIGKYDTAAAKDNATAGKYDTSTGTAGWNDPIAEEVTSAETDELSEEAAVRAYTGLGEPSPAPATETATPGTTGSSATQAPATRTTSLLEDGADANAADADTTSFDDYGRYRAGKPIDESTRLQLREERLRVDKSRVARGEATVGTETVTESHEFEVPFSREELFVERRPVSDPPPRGDAPPRTDAIEVGGDQSVRVPLTEERVVVTKVPIVTEEVVVGKRQVEDTQHVSETTRKQQLTVNDVGEPMPAGSSWDRR